MAKTLRPQSERTDELASDEIIMENIPTARELSQKNTLNEPKDKPHMRVLTDQTTSIRHIKVVGLVLTIMVIVMATSIVVLLFELKKKGDATEGKIDAIELKTAEDTTIIQKHTTILQQHTTVIAQLEWNRTTYLATIPLHNTRITDIEEELCKPNFFIFQGSCYYFSPDKLNWMQARDMCTNLGGYLAELTGMNENDYVTDQIPAIRGKLWIGGNDLDDEGVWRWVHSNTLINTRLMASYHNWKNGEPNNRYGAEDCLSSDDYHPGQWNDLRCRESHYYICEADIGK